MWPNNVLIFAFLFVAATTSANAATVRWNVDSSGFWDEGGNWSTGTVPQAGDDVIISRPAAAVTVTHRSGTTVIDQLTSSEALVMEGGVLTVNAPSTLQTLTLAGGTLDGTGTITIGGAFSWTAGVMGGTGVTTANGGILIANDETITLADARMLKNNAVATWTGMGNFSGGPNATFLNAESASFNVQTSADIQAFTFINEGTFHKSDASGDAVTRVSGAFQNEGNVEVSAGELRLDGGGTNVGTLSVGPQSVLQFGGGTHTLSGGFVSGAGTIRLAGATTNFVGGSYDIAGATLVTAGDHNFSIGVQLESIGTLIINGGVLELSSGELVRPTLYRQASGILDGSDTVTADTLLEWSGGTMGGSGTTNANAGMQLATTINIGITGTRTVSNTGLAIWSGSGNFGNSPAAMFNNLPGGTFQIQTAADFLLGNFNNAGTLAKQFGSGDGVTTFTGGFTNSGTVDVVSGALRFPNIYNQTAGVTRLNGGAITANTRMSLTGGTLAGDGTIVGDVTNSAVVSPGFSPGTLNITGNYTQNPDATFFVEISGLSTSRIDRIVVGGIATLSGRLVVQLTNGFVPIAGDTFDVVTFGSRSGDFASLEGAIFGGGLGFKKVLTASSVQLEVVHEICTDFIDNDADGFADCDDAKCSVVAICMGTPTATRTRTPTITQTGTVTPTGQATPSATQSTTPIATASPTASPTPTATPTPAADCIGDCNGDSFVTVDELVSGVNIALGNATLDRCPVYDRNQSGAVEINELITGVNNALNGCGATGAITTQTIPN